VFSDRRFLGKLLFSSLSLVLGTALAQETPWHLGSLNASANNAPSAINTAGVKPGPYEVVVAVIDAGVLQGHPSLEGRLLPGYDFLSAPHNPKGGRSANFAPDPRETKCLGQTLSTSFRTHGTEIASLIAGNGREKSGVYGVNPLAKILPIRLFGACNMSRTDLLDAMAWSAGLTVAGVPNNPNPAHVINLSFSGGGAVCGADLQALVKRLVQKKVFVVAAVGNTFGKKLAEPANCEGVISVGAVDPENNIESYSALDARTVIYAPGGGRRLNEDSNWQANKLKVASFDVDAKGEENPVGLARGVGTSYAAPLVSGFISLLLSHRPMMTPAEFQARLPQYSRAVNSDAHCAECAPRGLVLTNAAALVR
jgi:serine protease